MCKDLLTVSCSENYSEKIIKLLSCLEVCLIPFSGCFSGKKICFSTFRL